MAKNLKTDTTKTVTFRSENSELIQNLIDVFHSFNNKYKREKIENEKFHTLFSCNDEKANFVLKRILDDDKERMEHDYLAYLSDINCYSDLKELFSSKGIKIELVYDDNIMNSKELNNSVKNTYIIIGLFENMITDFINQQENKEGIYGIKRCFKIWREDWDKINQFKIEDISVI